MFNLFSKAVNEFLDSYPCIECEALMEKVDDETLVCPSCGHSVDIEDYTTEAEDYDGIYGRMDEDKTFGHDNEEFPGESYDDIFGDDDE